MTTRAHDSDPTGSSHAGAQPFAGLGAGLGFFQDWMKAAGAAMPGMSAPTGAGIPGVPSWSVPTLDPDELDKRIQELKTVQFWLEQNTTALKATIQALEVQKMTLTTLRTMNVGLTDMAQVFQQGMADTMSSVTQAVSAGARQPDADFSTPAEPTAAASSVGATPGASFGASPEESAAGEPSAPAEDAAAQPQGGTEALHAAFAQAGQWWAGMLQTFQSIAQQAQADVLERQEAFARAQQDMASSLTEQAGAADAATDTAADPTSEAPAAARAASPRRPARKAASAAPAGAGPSARPSRAAGAKSGSDTPRTSAARPKAAAAASGIKKTTVARRSATGASTAGQPASAPARKPR